MAVSLSINPTFRNDAPITFRSSVSHFRSIEPDRKIVEFGCRTSFRKSSLCVLRHPIVAVNASEDDFGQDVAGEVDKLGVKAALSVLNFYKSEISPLLPRSCRYVPTCSEYSMEAYKKYGFAKGTVLTAWRICRCNPLGGTGFDPPRWFDEPLPPEPEE